MKKAAPALNRGGFFYLQCRHLSVSSYLPIADLYELMQEFLFHISVEKGRDPMVLIHVPRRKDAGHRPILRPEQRADLHIDDWYGLRGNGKLMEPLRLHPE